MTDIIVSGKRYRSMTSIGKNVTFGGQDLRLEANIFDFQEDIYGETVEIIWLDKIRGMEKFSSADKLVEQLKKDKKLPKIGEKIAMFLKFCIIKIRR